MGSINKLFAGSPIVWFSLAMTLSLFFPLTGVADQGTSQDFNGLQEQLEQLGWRVERSSDGDLVLWPPGGQPAGSPPAAVVMQAGAARDKTISATDIELLRESLSDKGWDVRQSGDGSLLLYPDVAQTDAGVPATHETEETDQFEDVRALLSASGWRVERDNDGSLTLYPKVTSEEESKAGANNAVLQVDSSDLKGVRDALLASGWRLDEEPDGTLLLRLDSDVSAQGRRSGARGVQGVLVDPVASGEIKLPVDSWSEAHRIASFWLEQQPRKDLNIGKIRRVNWVYLVSIVGNSKPFRLNNQLAIRDRDGLIIPLY